MRRLARLSLADFGSLLLILLVAFYVAIINGHYSYDDAFITFRMAENLANGLGFVYNANEWHLASTAAFFGLVLGGLGWILGGTSIPAIAGVISSVSLLATGWMLYGLGRTGGAPLCGLVAGLFYVASPMIFVTFGGEMPFQLALITGAFFAQRRDARVVAAVLASLAIVTRPDGAVAAGVLFGWDAITRRRLPSRELIVSAVILLPFIALGWYAYGSPLPSTLAAKFAQRDSGLWPTYGRGLVDWVRLFMWNDRGPNLGFAPVAPPTLWLWALLGVAGVWRYRMFWPLLTWAVAFVLSYALMRIPFYHWYAAPAALALAIIAACGLCTAADLVLRIWSAARDPNARLARPAVVHDERGRSLSRRSWRQRLVTGAVVALAFGISLKPLLALPRTSALNNTVKLYIEAGHWLDANTPRSSSVGYYEIGYLGFYGHRRMIDALGLVDPAVSPAVARRDFAWAFRHARPDFILEKRGAGLNAFLSEPWFKEEYRPRATLSLGPGFPDALIVHERVGPPPKPES